MKHEKHCHKGGGNADCICPEIRAAVAEQKERDAKIAKHTTPQGEVVISWGMQETQPCNCPSVIAAAILEQP